METGYHLRFLKVDNPGRIDSADIVRVAAAPDGPERFGVQLHASAPPPRGSAVVLRLTRAADESESAFVKRAFDAAAAPGA